MFSLSKPNKTRILRAEVVALTGILAFASSALPAQTLPPQTPDVPLPIKPLPVPTGVIPLPQGAPSTGLQAPLPTPAQPLPKADSPLSRSPNLRSVEGFLQDRAITLQEAVSISLYTNRDFATAVATLQQARGRTGQARASLSPTVGVQGDLTYFDSATVADFASFAGGGQGANATPPLVITPQFNPTLGASLTLPLDVAGVLHAAVSQTQFQEVAARIDVNRVRNDVVYNVKNSFYNVLRAKAQIAVATDSLNNSLNRLNDANKNYAAGTSPRFDVISAQRDVANSQQDLINARAQLSINLASLKSIMGIGLQTKLRLTDKTAIEYPNGVLPPVLPSPNPSMNSGIRDTIGKANPLDPNIKVPPVETPQPVPAPPINRSEAAPKTPAGTPVPLLPSPSDEVEDDFVLGEEYETLIAEAVKTRPEVLESDARISAARRGIRYARRSQSPSLNLSLSDTYSPNAAGFTRRNVAALTLGVSVPIFDGGLAKARVLEARGIVASAEIDRRRSEDQVQVEVQQAYISLVQARNRVAVANVGLTQALEASRLARVRYNAGVSQQTGISPLLELSSAQSTLTQAQSNQVNALYDYNNSRAQLDRAVGRYAFTGSEPGYPSPHTPFVTGTKSGAK